MDAKLINPFLNSTLEIIKEFADVDYEIKKAYLKEDEKARGEVTGIVNLTGSGRGTVAVTFDKEMILYIVSSITAEKAEKIDTVAIDTVGELTNMISGRVVDKLARIGFDLNLSVPKVMHGKNHQVPHHTSGPKIAIPFASPKGNITVEFSFDKKAQPAELLKEKKQEPRTSAPAATGGKKQNPKDTGNKAPSNWGMPSEYRRWKGWFHFKKIPLNPPFSNGDFFGVPLFSFNC